MTGLGLRLLASLIAEYLWQLLVALTCFCWKIISAVSSGNASYCCCLLIGKPLPVAVVERCFSLHGDGYDGYLTSCHCHPPGCYRFLSST